MRVCTCVHVCVCVCVCVSCSINLPFVAERHASSMDDILSRFNVQGVYVHVCEHRSRMGGCWWLSGLALEVKQ